MMKVTSVCLLAVCLLTLNSLIAQDVKVNINSAGVSQLETLPGIGPALAARIIEFREKNGPFKKPEDLMNVRGIGEKKFLDLADRITVTPVAGEKAGAAKSGTGSKSGQDH